MGFTAVGMSAKSDKKYTGLFNELIVNAKLDRIDPPISNVVSTPQPSTGNIVSTPRPATIMITTYTPETIIGKTEKTNREEAQKRLDEDTKKVGFVRGEIYQLENGSWGIRWGGKYQL